MNAGHREHRPKNLVVVTFHARCDIVDEARVQEEASGRNVDRAVNHNSGPFARRTIHITLHLVAMLASDQRPHLAAILAGRPNLDRRNPVLDLGNQIIGDGLARQHNRNSHAPLPRAAIGSTDRGVSRHVEVCIGKHQHVVLGAAKRLHSLAVLGASLIDVASNGRATDKADSLHIRMLQEAINSHLVTIHNVEAPIGQTRLLQQFADEHARRRILLARLEHERVATSQGVGKHPHWNHCRKVERRDAGHNPKRLLDAVHVHTSRRLLAVPTLHQVGDAASKLDVLQPPSHLAQRIAKNLAVLLGEQSRNLLAIRINQLAHMKHDLRPPRKIRSPPSRKGSKSSSDSQVNLGRRSQVHGRCLLARSRIKNHPRPPRSPLDHAAINPVRNAIHNESFDSVEIGFEKMLREE